MQWNQVWPFQAAVEMYLFFRHACGSMKRSPVTPKGSDGHGKVRRVRVKRRLEMGSKSIAGGPQSPVNIFRFGSRYLHALSTNSAPIRYTGPAIILSANLVLKMYHVPYGEWRVAYALIHSITPTRIGYQLSQCTNGPDPKLEGITCRIHQQCKGVASHCHHYLRFS
jgi:hypothetical protein